MKKEFLIVVVGITFALAYTWWYLGPKMKTEVTHYDRVQLQRLVDDLNR